MCFPFERGIVRQKMEVASRLIFLICAGVFLSTGFCTAQESRVLHVAADPNNLPFSNQQLEGFENKIAALIAHELNATIDYTWRAQRRGFFRETLKEGNADLILGVPSCFERALTTDPYYHSSYVFVCRKDGALRVRSFDDPILRTARIGVQLIGDDGANTPPVHVLSVRGIVTNVVGFTVYGDYAQQNPTARIVDAVVKREVDVAIVWGPVAGYFARKESEPLEITPVPLQPNRGASTLAFDISMGVSRRNKELLAELNAVLKRKQSDIRKILNDYGVPGVAEDRPAATF